MVEKLRPLLASGLALTALATDLLLPPRCLGCGTVIRRGGALCAECWSGLRFITPPLCIVCGFPFAQDEGEVVLCAECMASPPAFTRARAALVYDAASRPLILDLKHRDRHEGVAAFAGWLRLAGGAELAQADAVLPVPLHRWRLLRRRFNQSALLARALARDCHLDFLPQVLVRTRATPSQGGLSGRQRRLNMRGAFAVPEPQRARIEGRRLVLVDDVYTTGATVGACARALLRGGAESVVVLTLARVLRTTP